MTLMPENPPPGGKVRLPSGKSLVLIGLMGAGKSSVGRRVAKILNLPFVDADEEVERAAGCSVEDIFRLYGEDAFRDGEERVIARLLEAGPQVLATGGGAFMNPRTREHIRKAGVSAWLRADLDLLVRRTSRRSGRPLLAHGNPRETLERLIEERYPIYAEADIVIDTTDENIELMVDRLVAALANLGDAAEVAS